MSLLNLALYSLLALDQTFCRPGSWFSHTSYPGRSRKVGHALIRFVVLLSCSSVFHSTQSLFYFSAAMAELQEIPLKLQLCEANRRITAHLSKGRKHTEFLLPMFLRRFPAIMDSHLTVNWDSILGVYKRTSFFPISLIDTDILDDWCTHPSVWEAPPKQ